VDQRLRHTLFVQQEALPKVDGVTAILAEVERLWMG
jgi:hypothetical protein